MKELSAAEETYTREDLPTPFFVFCFLSSSIVVKSARYL